MPSNIWQIGVLFYGNESKMWQRCLSDIVDFVIEVVGVVVL